MEGSSALKNEAPGAWLGKSLRAGLALIVGMACWSAGPAHAQAPYPNKPIKWIVPFAPGGSGDLIARVLAERLTQALGQPVVIDNRGGNGSVLGTELAAKATPDGYTWVLSNGAAITTGPLMGQNLGYKPLEDFVHIALIGSFANALIVRADHPARSVQDLLNLAREQPGKLSYGSAGVGSAGNLTGELLKQLAKIQMVHVPYKGSGPALNDLLGGQIDLMFNALIASAPHIRAGRVRALAVTGAQRDREFAQVPTLAETVPGAVGDAWFGLSVPARTPPAVVERLRVEMVKVLSAPETRNKLAEMGMQTLNLGPREFQDFLVQENRKWAPVIRSAQIRIE
ncbi:MAG: Bug family tripartite tricarboxylate transporter substrate binding protein [Betaproteobacteria bacterium]